MFVEDSVDLIRSQPCLRTGFAMVPSAGVISILASTDSGNIIREAEPVYASDRICFICGCHDEDKALAGSSPLCDWVHLECLKQPFVWD